MENNIHSLIEAFNDKAISLRQLIYYASKDYKKEVEEITSFVDTDDIIERLYYLVYDIHEQDTCPYCGKKCTFTGRIKDGYRPTCNSKECQSKNFTKIKTGNKSTKNKVSEFEKYQAILSSDSVNDDLIKTIFYPNKKGLRRVFIPLIKEPILSYLKNRYKDSDSIEETLERINLGIEEKPKCPMCGNPVGYIGKPSRMFHTYCSGTCANRSPETVEKKHATQELNWGSKHCFDSSLYQKHLKETIGVEYHWQREDIKEKRKETLIEHFGTTAICHLPEIKEKSKQTCIERYGVENPLSLPEFQKKHLETRKKNHSFKGFTSTQELDIRDFLSQYFHDLEWQYFSDEYPFNCDFYIPSLKLYIEYNGSQYHHDHFFDENNKDDIERAELLKSKIKTNPKNAYWYMYHIWLFSDIKKKKFVEENNIKMIWLWGTDYNKGLEHVLNVIDSYIKKNIDPNFELPEIKEPKIFLRGYEKWKKRYEEERSLTQEEKDILNKGISKEADKIILKYFLNKDGRVISNHFTKDYLKYKKEITEYLEKRFSEPSDNFNETVYRLINNIEERPSCKICGKRVSFYGYKRGYADCCSVKCSMEKRKRDNIKTTKFIKNK